MESTMKPGRELDALIAEKVMGLVKLKVQWSDGSHSGFNDVWFQNGFEKYRQLPEYSTDISAAWEVVEKMRKLGWLLDLNLQARYTATFRRNYMSETPRHEAKEDAAPNAICLAALKAVECI